MAKLVLFLSLFVLFSSSFVKADTVPEKEWAFLVFLNGHNDLDPYGPMNLNHMETVGSTENTHVVVQWASLANQTTKRLYIQKDEDLKNVTSPVIEELPRVDMGDYRSLVDFVNWAVKKYPAKHYFIDIWNHGNGWVDGKNAAPLRWISHDELSNHRITTPELGVAVGQIAKVIGHRIDLLGTDACLMAMLEVMDEVSDSVEMFVASEEVEPGEGWPYHHFFSEWQRTKAQTAAEVGKVLAKEFVKYYQSGELEKSEVTLSVVDLRKIGRLKDAVETLSSSLKELAKQNPKGLLEAAAKALAFEEASYVDIGDLVKAFESLSPQEFVLNDLRAVREALQESVQGVESTPQYQRAMGLSIWWPKGLEEFKENAVHYSQLKFSSKGNWGNLLQVLWQ